MLGIVAYVISVYLLYELWGGFDEEQWVLIITASIVGFIYEVIERHNANRKDE